MAESTGMARMTVFGVYLLAAGCAAATHGAVSRGVMPTGLAGTWTSTRVTQVGPAKMTLSFDCDYRYELQGLVLGLNIEERGRFRITAGAIEFERRSGEVTTSPYRLEGDRLILTEHPTETYTYARVNTLTCDPRE